MTNDNSLIKASSPAAAVTRVDGSNFVEERGTNPLMRLHLLLYGRYRWALLLGLLLAVSGGLLVWTLMPPKYQVVGYVRVRPYIPPVLAATDQNGVLPMFESFVALQESLLHSQRVLDQASQATEWKALRLNSAAWGQGIPADHVVIDHPKGSEIVTVEVTERDVNVAAVAVKAILDAYLKISGETNGAGDQDRLQALDGLQTSLTNQERILSERILSLAQEFGSDDLERRYDFKTDELNKLESQLQQITLDLSLAQAAAGKDVSTTAPASQPAIARVTLEDVARIDPRMRDYLTEQDRLSLQLSQLESHLGENHSEVIAVETELGTVKEEIEALLSTYQKRANNLIPLGAGGEDGSRLSLPELRAREANVLALYKNAKVEAVELGRKDLEIRNLKQQRESITQELDKTKARIEQLNLEAQMSGRISVLSYGESPTVPLTNKRIPAAAAASVFGFVAGIGLIALRGFADRRVRSVLHMQQLEPAVRILGVLPILPENLTDSDQKSQAAHCVHQIRNLLDLNTQSGKGRVLAVTSPAAGDGKTSLTLALGLSFAGTGSRTLLVDCDMVGGGLTNRLNALVRDRIGNILRRAGLLTEQQIVEVLRRMSNSPTRRFGDILIELGYVTPPDIERALLIQSESSVGLLEALDGDPLATCVTNILADSLFVLPLGKAAAHHTSQMSAKALRRIFKEARGQFDVVIVDTGPILGSLEASIVARGADEVILAIARDEQAPFVTRALVHLASLGAHVAGLVFNRATPQDIAHSHYGSSASMGSFRSTARARTSTQDSRNAVGASPRLGPIASAVVTSAENGSPKEPTNQ